MPTLLHVSDVHFGPKHLAGPALAVADLVARERPDVVVVSGDLTQRAKPGQFRAAREYVAALAAPVVFVPGNHDVPLWRVWERVFSPFGAWRRHFAPELVRDHVADGLAVLGVNTAHGWTTKHGRLTGADVEDLEARLVRLPAAAIRVVVAHHPVAAAPELGDEPVARRAGRLLETARRHGVAVVLCGHLHHAFAVPSERSSAGRGPLVVHCGTTTSSRGRGPERGRNSLHWIRLEHDETVVERRYWDAAAAAFVAGAEARFAAPAERRSLGA